MHDSPGHAISADGVAIAHRARLGSAATAGEGIQNLLCAYLALAVLAGLAGSKLFGAWWLHGPVALGIAGWALIEGRRAWRGQTCHCATCT